MNEYEYSFKVENINKYIEYCEKKSYKLVSKSKQIRTIYKNNGLMARITQNIVDNKEILILDFKEDKLSNSDLTIRKESKEIVFDSLDNCKNILTFLNYKKDIELVRERIKYANNDNSVVFEIDIYTSPDKQNVVAIEGNKELVDKVYTELKNIKYF